MRWILAVAAILAAMAGAATAKTQKAILAGGCFWCVEANFEGVKGVKKVVSGYTGGSSANPTYDDHEGHLEAVEVTFDDAVVSYAEILRLFLHSTDVLDAGGQFCDRGPAYVSAIFVTDSAQKSTARQALSEAAAALGQEPVTRIRSAGRFWPAEAEHQDFWKGKKLMLTRGGLKTQAEAYRFYRKSCGRDARVKALWGKDAAFVH